jgi:hypothetical protein
MPTRNASSAGKRKSRAGKKSAVARKRATAASRGGRTSARKTASRSGGERTRAEGRTQRRGGRSQGQDAIAMLKEDHERVQEMFDRFERARSDDQKQQLAERICDDLTLHAEIEEEIFYPAVREAIDDEDLMDEAEVEHASAKELIAQIRAGKFGDPQWEAKVTVLGEYVKHHIKEEQKEMFPKARAAKLDLRALGEQIAARKQAGSMGTPRTEREADAADRKAGTRDEDEDKDPGILESAVRTLLPGNR